MSRGSASGAGVAGLGGGCFLIILLLNLLLGGVATQYVTQFWGGYFTGHAVFVPFLICALAGLIVGQFTIPVAVITFLISFFLKVPGYSG